jgi:hypothetical protein
MKERTDTFKWEVGERPLRPEDAGTTKHCDYCGFRYDFEKLVKDQYNYWSCPTCLFAPAPTLGHGFSSDTQL